MRRAHIGSYRHLFREPLIMLSRLKQNVYRLIPSQYRFYAVDLKNRVFGDFARKYYSQFGEDIIVDTLLKTVCTGFYVDVGAHHPRRYSNTYLLYKRGWRGINIDPDPESVAFFKRDRPGDTHVQCGVSDRVGEQPFYIFSDPAVNTFSERQACEWMKKSWVSLVKKEMVPVRSLKQLLTEHVPAGTMFNLLNVDTEGFDLTVLKSNDWKRFRPQIIIVESHGFNVSRPNDDPVYAFLTGQSYRLYSRTGPSLIFTAAEPATRLA